MQGASTRRTSKIHDLLAKFQDDFKTQLQQESTSNNKLWAVSTARGAMHRTPEKDGRN